MKLFGKTVTMSIMIIIIIYFFAADLFTSETNAAKFNHTSLGIKLDVNFSRLPYDLRYGISINSPYFFYNILSLKAEYDIGNVRGVPVITTNSNEIWVNYSVIKTGISARTDQRSETVRPYGEIGYIYAMLGNKATDDLSSLGIYSLVGFDLLFDPGDFKGLFFELGAAGMLTGGKAEKFVGSPGFISGIIMTGGCRFYF